MFPRHVAVLEHLQDALLNASAAKIPLHLGAATRTELQPPHHGRVLRIHARSRRQRLRHVGGAQVGRHDRVAEPQVLHHGAPAGELRNGQRRPELSAVLAAAVLARDAAVRSMVERRPVDGRLDLA